MAGQNPDVCTPSLFDLASGLEDILVILGYGRSGTIFFQSLLDGHSHIIVMPGTYMNSFGAFYEKHGNLPADELVKQFTKYFAGLFNATEDGHTQTNGESQGFTRMGPNQDLSLTLDRDLFSKSLTEILNPGQGSISRKFLFQAVHVAYARALGQQFPVDGKLFMAYSLHAGLSKLRKSRQAKQIAEDFPNAKYIYVVREPLKSLASMYKTIPLQDTKSHLHGFLFGAIYPVNDEQASKTIRLEDLHAAPQATLEKVCCWLGIPWENSLLTSTFQGLEWWGDYASIKTNGFSASILTSKKHTDVLTPFDVFRLEVLLAHKYQAWRYAISGWRHNALVRLAVLPLLLLPLKIEWMSLLLRRKHMIETYQRDLRRKQGRLIRLRILCWFLGLPSLTVFMMVRALLILAWFDLFTKNRTEVRLL